MQVYVQEQQYWQPSQEQVYVPEQFLVPQQFDEPNWAPLHEESNFALLCSPIKSPLKGVSPSLRFMLTPLPREQSSGRVAQLLSELSQLKQQVAQLQATVQQLAAIARLPMTGSSPLQQVSK